MILITDSLIFFAYSTVDDTGRIFMWNMAPVVDAQVEEDENVPRMLCVLDNHSGNDQNKFMLAKKHE